MRGDVLLGDTTVKDSKGFLDAEIARRYYDRIGDALERKPVNLQPGAHRERLKALLGGLGEMSFYELLGVKPGASDEEIHEAYSELAMIVHPSHAKNLGMGTSSGGLELLFERVTEAYLTLNDPDRSRTYQMATGIAPAASNRPSAEQRRKEQIEQADRLYRVSRGLVVEGRYHEAVQTLRQAVRLDPKAEHYALLGECLARNPNWLKDAAKAYESAVERSPHDPHLRTELALVQERAGSFPRAEENYKTALSFDPEFADALAGLARLRGRRREPEATGSLWSRVASFVRESLSGLRSR
jgi:curved DNA-binding protein CbpA